MDIMAGILIGVGTASCLARYPNDWVLAIIAGILIVVIPRIAKFIEEHS